MARKRSPLAVTASPFLFSKKNGPITPVDQNPHQTVTRFGCVGFSMYACGFSVPQNATILLVYIPPRSKWTSSEKMIFLAKIGIFCKSIAGPLPSIVQAYTQPYSFGGWIKLIICQIRHELSVAIHKISTNWKKKVRCQTLCIHNRSLHLASYTIHVMCVNFNMISKTHSLKSTLNNRFLRNFSWQFYLHSRVFS